MNAPAMVRSEGRWRVHTPTSSGSTKVSGTSMPSLRTTRAAHHAAARPSDATHATGGDGSAAWRGAGLRFMPRLAKDTARDSPQRQGRVRTFGPADHQHASGNDLLDDGRGDAVRDLGAEVDGDVAPEDQVPRTGLDRGDDVGGAECGPPPELGPQPDWPPRSGTKWAASRAASRPAPVPGSYAASRARRTASVRQSVPRSLLPASRPPSASSMARL